MATIESLLGAANLRRTPVRAGVLEVLAGSPRPLSAVETLAQLPPQTDAVTVYRTLNTLTAKKLLHRVQGEDRVWRYALTDQHRPPEHLHPHFVCESCGKVECLRNAEVPGDLLSRLRLPRHYQVSYAEVILHGLCPKCRG